MVDGLRDFPPAKDGNAMAFAFGVDHVHFQTIGNAVENALVVGLYENDDIGPLGFDYLGQRVGAAFAAVEDVVA
jgi:hypothetical protein